MSECTVCQTPLEQRGSRSFCPACLLRDVMQGVDEPTEVLSASEIAASGLPQVARFSLLERLGEGGFATVYRAMQCEPVRREVAVKVLKPQVASGQVLARFEAERRSLARMEHPGIARFWDSGVTHEGLPFFAMELVRGEPVTLYCLHQNVALRDRLEIFCDICEAVQHAHEKGVLHRDLKPSNILVAGSPAGRQVKIIDFGIAKALEVTPETTELGPMTAIHQTVGTPGYMSPEQTAWGTPNVDVRSDLYALGVVLYELLTGSTPLQVEVRADDSARQRAVAEHVVPPSQLPRSLLETKIQKRDLDAITRKATAKDSSLRYPSAAAFAEDVRRHLNDEPVQAGELSWTYVMEKFTRRHLPFVVSGGLALVAVLGGFTVSTVLYFKEQQARSRAQHAQEAVEAREAELRRTLSRADFAAAQRAKVDGDYQGAIACLTRALRQDPDFHSAAADLQMLLVQENTPQCTTPKIQLDPAWGKVVNGAVSANGLELAVNLKSDTVERLVLFKHGPTGWQAHQQPLAAALSALALAASGNALAYADAGNTVHLMDTHGEGAVPRTWQAPGAVTALAISVTSSVAAIGCNDGTVWLLSLKPEIAPRLLGKISGVVTHLHLGLKDNWVVAGGKGGEVVRLENTATPQQESLLKMPSAISALAFSSNPGLVAAGDAAGNVACRDGTETARLPVTRVHDGRITALALAGDGTTLISAGGGPTLQVRWLDMSTKTDVTPPLDSAGTVRSVWPVATEDEVLLINADSSVRVWRQNDAVAARTIRKPQQAKFIAMSAAGQCMAVQRDLGAALETLKLDRHVTLGMALSVGRQRQGVESPVRVLGFREDGRFLVAAGGAARAILWDMSTGRWSGNARWPSQPLALAPAGGGMLAALQDGSLYEISTEGADPVLRVPATPDVTWAAASVSPDGRAVVWSQIAPEGVTNSQVRVWWAVDGSVQMLKAERVSAVAVHGGSHVVAFGLGNGHVRVLPDGGRNLLQPLHQTRVTSLNFSSDGRTLITASTDGTAALWDPRTLQPLTESFQLGAQVRLTALSGDGRRFACATGTELFLGEVEARALLGRPLHLQRLGGALALNHDGTQVAVSTTTGETFVHDVAPRPASAAPEWLLTLAETYVSRRMTPLGAVERTDHPGLAAMQALIPVRVGDDEWTSLARWMFTHTGLRTLSPWSPLTLDAYIDSVQERPGTGRYAEINRLQPYRYRSAGRSEAPDGKNN